MTNRQEAIITVAAYLFVVSSFTLAILIPWFAVQYKKRLNRLDKILDIVEETNKYYEKDSDRTKG